MRTSDSDAGETFNCIGPNAIALYEGSMHRSGIASPAAGAARYTLAPSTRAYAKIENSKWHSRRLPLIPESTSVAARNSTSGTKLYRFRRSGRWTKPIQVLTEYELRNDEYCPPKQLTVFDLSLDTSDLESGILKSGILKSGILKS